MGVKAAILYDCATAQALRLVVAPFLAANAAVAVPVSGGSAATLTLKDSGGTALTDYTALAVSWSGDRRELYRSQLFPAATFPTGIYIAEWSFIVDSGSATAPEPRQTIRELFEVRRNVLRPVLTPERLWGAHRRLQEHDYTDTAVELAGHCERAWDALWADLEVAAHPRSPHEIYSPSAVALAHEAQALHLAFKAISRDPEEGMTAHYAEQYDGLLRKALATAVRDPQDSGVPTKVGGLASGQLVC